MSLFQQIVELAAPYFDSPAAADQFLARQCQRHLNCEPANLGPHDLWNLAKWVMVSGDMLVGKHKAEQLSDKIRALRKSLGELPLRERMHGGELGL